MSWSIAKLIIIWLSSANKKFRSEICLIPLCHPLMINKVNIDFDVDRANCLIYAYCTVKCNGKTGVEMEALTGVNVCLLTIYDMCKAVSKDMEIKNVHLVSKSGGKSGDFVWKE